MFQQINNYFQNNFLQNDLAVAGVITAITGSLFYSLKSVPITIWYFVKRKFTTEFIIEEGNMLYVHFNEWLYKTHSKQFKSVSVKICYDDEDGELITAAEYIQHDDSFVFWYKGTPIFLSKNREKLEGAHSIYETHRGIFVLKTFFNSKKLKELINEINSLINIKLEKKKELCVYMFDVLQSEWIFHNSSTPIPWDDIVTSNDIKDNLMYVVKEHKKNGSFLKKKGIKNTLGIGLDGEPGNGKTSMIASLAFEIGINLFYLDINALKNIDDLKHAFLKIPRGAGLVMEDIDKVWNGRQAIDPNCKVTFSAFINHLNGLLQKDDLIVFFTTNKIHELDDALTRDGRMDFKGTVEPPNEVSTIQYIEKFYNQKFQIPEGYRVEKALNFALISTWCKYNIYNPEKVLKNFIVKK